MRAVPMTRRSTSASPVEIALETVTGSVTSSHVVKLARTEAVRPIAAMRPTLHRVARVINAFVELVAAASNSYWFIACASFAFSPASCRLLTLYTNGRPPDRHRKPEPER
jgi:hypothetical protein